MSPPTGLYADGETKVTEPVISRNHSEIMLRYFGADIRTEGICRLSAVMSDNCRQGSFLSEVFRYGCLWSVYAFM